MRLFDVMTKKEFSVDGELKTIWNQVGIVKMSKRGNMYLHLHYLPNVEFYLFNSNEETKLPDIQLEDSEED